MLRIVAVLMSGILALSACAPAGPQVAGSGARAYSLNGVQPSRIRFRVLDAVNALRQNNGLAPLKISEALNTAAANHARDMAMQQRPWHFGSDGSSPVMRVQRAGYARELIGEDIAESYETELEILGAWMQNPTTRDAIMSAQSEDLGLGWFQESNGKIWWTLIVGGGTPVTPPTVTPRANTAPPGATPTVPVATGETGEPTETSDAGGEAAAGTSG